MSVAPFYNKTVTGINSSGGTVDLSAPGPIGAGTPSTGAFTTLTSSGVVNTGGMNGTIGATTPNTGVFTITQANNVILTTTKTTVTANTTIITLTAASNGNQLLVETGVGNYTGCIVNLPSTATLTVGEQYFINNNCTTTSWVVQTSTAAAVVTSGSGALMTFTVLSIASDVAASWDFHVSAPAQTTWSSAALATSAVINASNGFNGTIGAVTPATGKHTTLQLTTSMATAGVLLNDTSGNITSSLGALAVAKGGTGVAASYGTGTTVALPPTGGVAGQALLSGAGAGAALTWGIGQCGAIARAQSSGTSCPTATLTTLVYQTASSTSGQGALITHSAGTFTYTGAGTATILITATVCFSNATNISLVINPSTGNSTSTAVTTTFTQSCTAVVFLATNGTFLIQVNQQSGGTLTSTTGTGANATLMTAVILPI